MTADDNPQVFVEAFVVAFGVMPVVACTWPAAEWAVRLLPLLSRESQKAAHSLPSMSQRNYSHLKKDVLDRLGLTSEDPCHWFRQARLGSHDQPFAFAQRLLHAATRWLCPDDSFTDQLVERNLGQLSLAT